MALTQKLEIRQGHALVMTPQLMQAIKLLQLSNLDLAAYVENELERNPLLERGDNDGDNNGEPADAAEQAQAPPEEIRAGDWLGEDLAPSRSEIESRLGTNLENVFPDDQQPSGAPGRESPGYSEWASIGSGGREDGDHDLESFISVEKTLSDHLAEQLALATSDPARRIIGQNLIDLVDEAGYLQGDPAAVADRLAAPRGLVEEVLALLQTFDPTGVCARTLGECLALQLRERDRFDPAMQALVAHLELVAKRDFAALKRICGVEDDDLADMIAEIRRLDPKPGLAFGSARVQPVVPDVYVRPAPDGAWAVELNSDTLPKVLVNQSYYAQVSRAARGGSERAYLADCLQNASWLVRALDQRANTILKVAAEIARQQDAFLARGIEHLRPLNLKTVAEAVGMHESTVSRVTANKYMMTTRGVFEMKYFFSAAIAASNGGEAHSAEAVRHRIRQLIESEGEDEILSDDTIVDRLRSSGVDIARRTVAKYREAMRIPSSVHRRREKQTSLTEPRGRAGIPALNKGDIVAT